MLGGEPERELAGLGVGVACWAPATPPGPGGLMCLQADPGAPAGPLLPTSDVLRPQPAAQQGPRRVRRQPRPSASAFRDRALKADGRAPVGSAELDADTGPGLSLCDPGQVPAPPAPGLRLPFVRCQTGVGFALWFPASALQENERWRPGCEFFSKPMRSFSAGPSSGRGALLVASGVVFPEMTVVVAAAISLLPDLAK